MAATKTKRKKKISRTIIGYLLILALVICVFTSIMVALLYYRSQVNVYGRQAFSLARSAADYIDGDRVQGYLDTMEKDEYYQRVQGFLDSIKREHDIWYYYVYVHDGDELIYVWDAWNEDGVSELGDREAYIENGRELAEAVLQKNPPEEFVVSNHPQFGLIGTARSPVFDSQGNAVAIVGVDLNMPDLERLLLAFQLTVVIAVIFVTAVGGVVFFVMLRRRIVTPIQTLDQATRDIVGSMDSDEPFKVDIHTGDELEALANSFSKMHRGMRNYIQELNRVTAEKERIGAELNVATQIQADMLPRIFPPFPDRTEFDIFASMNPAKEVGGDFYDFFLVDDDHIALVMADVSGKGVPAALFMVIAKSLIKSRVQMGDGPAKALMNVNEQLCEGNEAELFVTVWLAVIQLSTGKGMAVNAGHEHPVLRRKDGKYELVVYRHSPAVATMEGMRFREHEFQLNPGDSLFVYTDGVAEATDAHNELYGTDRMLDALNADPNADPHTLLTSMKASIDGFVGQAPQFDDITMLNFQYKGPQGPAGASSDAAQTPADA